MVGSGQQQPRTDFGVLARFAGEEDPPKDGGRAERPIGAAPGPCETCRRKVSPAWGRWPLTLLGIDIWKEKRCDSQSDSETIFDHSAAENDFFVAFILTYLSPTP